MSVVILVIFLNYDERFLKCLMKNRDITPMFGEKPYKKSKQKDCQAHALIRI